MTNEVEIGFGREPLDVPKIKKVYADLINGVTHRAPCMCPSCSYQFYRKNYKGRGDKFGKEIFFLDWLECEMRLSMIDTTEKIVYKNVFKKGSYIKTIDGVAYFKIRGVSRALSEFVKKEFPEINPKPQIIKLNLWRFKKSGIPQEIEKRINLESIKSKPGWKREWRQSIAPWSLAQRIADFIYSQPNRRATQRQLLRRFSNKRSDDLEALHGWLELNYGINYQKGKSIYYIGSMNTSRGKLLRIIKPGFEN